jgi:hypothetical protein
MRPNDKLRVKGKGTRVDPLPVCDGSFLGALASELEAEKNSSRWLSSRAAEPDELQRIAPFDTSHTSAVVSVRGGSSRANRFSGGHNYCDLCDAELCSPRCSSKPCSNRSGGSCEGGSMEVLARRVRVPLEAQHLSVEVVRLLHVRHRDADVVDSLHVNHGTLTPPSQPRRACPTMPAMNVASPASSHGNGFKCWSHPLAVAVRQQVVPGPARCTQAT